MEKKRKLVILAIIPLCVVLLLFGTYKLMNSRTYQLFGEITSQVETNQRAVALTFDDGPSSNVDEILALLDQYDAKATFFVIGDELEKYPEEGRKIANAGHQIGNHSYSHTRMIFKTPSFIKQEIETTNRLIRETGYDGEIDFRPPNGKKLLGVPWYLKSQNIETITWNLEPDTFYRAAGDKVAYVTQHIKPGSIILLHPMYDQTGNELETIEGILDTLSKQGYTFVTVNELQRMAGHEA